MTFPVVINSYSSTESRYRDDVIIPIIHLLQVLHNTIIIVRLIRPKSIEFLKPKHPAQTGPIVLLVIALVISFLGIDSYGNQTLYQTQCKFRDSYFQCKVKAVRLGQNTASFKNYRLPMLEHLSFSLVLGCHRTLDITCKDEYEVVYSLWSFIHLMPWRSDLTPEDISPPKNQDVDGNFLLLQISS